MFFGNPQDNTQPSLLTGATNGRWIYCAGRRGLASIGLELSSFTLENIHLHGVTKGTYTTGTAWNYENKRQWKSRYLWLPATSCSDMAATLPARNPQAPWQQYMTADGSGNLVGGSCFHSCQVLCPYSEQHLSPRYLKGTRTPDFI